MTYVDTPPSPRNLRQRREALRLSRQEFAAAVHCSISYLATLEAGAIPARSSAVLDRALLVLDQFERARAPRGEGVG